MLDPRMTQWKRILLWMTLLMLTAFVTYFAMRGYFSPEMLFNLANSLSC